MSVRLFLNRVRAGSPSLVCPHSSILVCWLDLRWVDVKPLSSNCRCSPLLPGNSVGTGFFFTLNASCQWVFIFFFSPKTVRTDVKLTCAPESSPSRSTEQLCLRENTTVQPETDHIVKAEPDKATGSLQGLEKHLGNHNTRNLGLESHFWLWKPDVLLLTFY